MDLDERTAYTIARAFADVWFNRNHRTKTYHYATMPLGAVAEMGRVPAPEDGYLSEDENVRAIRDLLAKGYRWVRSDGEWAVFERIIETPPR